ncbi:chondroitin AC/alginate lyase [Lentinus tigrinus ALCF2SS1-7]|uniref:Chondroitin AC/alginate lyase n=1 Tax=Lentinus tigrinus ALCF2SS1-6 TaxID=1328759 RepID=A0A5C2SCX7_9APHY|nr:chondroitin AC/alginate lyase [Lentinus tigrinus ALCF2SS1-6]RPD76176.1 chondroitin AC/alginate lyase [Lentinus tigrinus ALCF2SS1-7]
MRPGTSFSFTAVLSVASLLLSQLAPVHAVTVTNYANDFIDPQYVLSKDFSNITVEAQDTIISWAQTMAAQGPWSVMNKTYAPPTGNKHDYMSWAPYWWPDCSNVGNTTELTPEEIWVTCPYVSRDGLFNPDGRTINDIGEFEDMANAILYNALAWAINGSSVYSANVARFVNTWFLAADTAMTTNLAYAQMERGPNGQNGTHTGILDLKCMAKVVSGVLILREGKAAEWTSDIDTALNSWTTEYISWLTTAKIALEEKAATNNHGTFYYNQLAALQILVGDNAGAKKTLEEYFTTQYTWQIAANGDQPLETARTRPYHYRAYNLAAMITNAKLGAYIGYDVWNLTSKNGKTIKDALDYAITLPAGKETASELWPNVVAVGAVYGDADGAYAKWMLDNAGNTYPADAQFLWNQPFSDSGLVKADATTTSSGSSSTSGVRQEDGARSIGASWNVLAMAVGAAMLAVFA